MAPNTDRDGWFWDLLNKIGIVHTAWSVVVPAIMSAVTIILGYLQSLPWAVTALLAFVAIGVGLWIVNQAVAYQAQVAVARSDVRLQKIQTQLERFAQHPLHDDTEAQRWTQEVVEYLSSALSADHGRVIREKHASVMRPGESGWLAASRAVKTQLRGLIDSLSVDEIKPFSSQSVGPRTTAEHRVLFDVPPREPHWKFSPVVKPDRPAHTYRTIDATGSGFEKAQHFQGPTETWSDYDCPTPISRQCRVRVVYRPSSAYVIYVRLGVHLNSGAFETNRYFIVGQNVQSTCSQYHGLEWRVVTPHETLPAGWVETVIDIESAFKETFDDECQLHSVLGFRIRGNVDLACVEFLPRE